MRYLILASFYIAIVAACSAPLPTPTIAPSALAPTPTSALTAIVPAPTRPVAPTPTDTPLTITKDISYALPLPPNDMTWKLDVYAPTDKKRENVSLVLFLHGFAEAKEDYTRLYRLIAQEGAIVFGVEWPERPPFVIRNEPRKIYRHSFETITCALRFARANYGGDQARLILVGFSAGAGASAAVAFGGDATSQFDALGVPPQVRCAADALARNRVDAFLGIGGPYGWAQSLQQQDPGLWQIVNPYAHLENKNLRARLLHGEFDNVVPIDSSIQFNSALQKAGFDVQFIKYNQGHAVPFDLTISELKKLW